MISFTVTIEKDDLRPMVKKLVIEEIPHARERLQFTHAEAAEMLGLTQESLHGERRKGRITGRRAMRNRYYYRPEDLKAYVDSPSQTYDDRLK